MVSNIHKKLTEEDKFGRKFYSKKVARKLIKMDKKRQSKKIRVLAKKEIDEINEEN